ncbi:MAG: hypothetical protein KA752_03345 [Giesbergeria sp.]|nr:hypothetical protein [Giesbergeria sp.]
MNLQAVLPGARRIECGLALASLWWPAGLQGFEISFLLLKEELLAQVAPALEAIFAMKFQLR